MSHRYRLYPDAGQERVLVRHCGDARFVWNLALEQANMWRPGQRPVDMGAWDRQLADARRGFGWLAEGSSSVQQAALRDLRQAFRNWWSRPDHFGKPKWRKRGRSEGFAIRDLSVRVLNRRWANITVPKAGRVKLRLSRPLPSGARSARVTLDRAGRWHVSVVALPQPLEGVPSDGMVGVDLGVAASVTLSTGQQLHLPVLLSHGEQQRRRRLQRRLARQQAGSNRRARTKRALARISVREADRRRDWVEKTTTNLVRSFGELIAVEDLRVSNMVRSAKGTRTQPGSNVAAKRGLNREIHNQAWALFRRRLTDKASLVGTPIVAVNPHNTSQRCHQCGHTSAENRKNQAVFSCQGCRLETNADHNAALNILAAGLLAVTGRGGTPHASAQRPNETSTTRNAA